MDVQSPDREELQSQIRLLMLFLRRGNRLAHFRNRKVRADVASVGRADVCSLCNSSSVVCVRVEERVKVDEEYLKLQNFLHEIQHLVKEIHRCVDFKSVLTTH